MIDYHKDINNLTVIRMPVFRIRKYKRYLENINIIYKTHA